MTAAAVGPVPDPAARVALSNRRCRSPVPPSRHRPPNRPQRPPSEPVTTPDIDMGAVARDALTDALEAAWPALRDKAVGYAKDSVKDIMAGQTVDVLNPTITAETKAGKELVIADAKSRSWRTLVQGLAIDLFAAVLAVIGTLSGADPFVKETWLLVGALLIKTVIQTVAAYVMRLRVTPTVKLQTDRFALMPVPRPMIKEDKEIHDDRDTRTSSP